jgi:hypothetical protein
VSFSSSGKTAGLTYNCILWHPQDAPTVPLKVQNVIDCSSCHKYRAIFCASDARGYTDYDDHDYLNHGYYIIGYLDITSRLRLQQHNSYNSSPQCPRHHLHP